MEQETTFMDKMDRLNENLKSGQQLVRMAAHVGSDTINTISEVVALLPLLEIVVTIGVFYGTEMGQRYGLEVIVGLVFSQMAALYLVNHYRDIAMHPIGQAAIYFGVILGAMNTMLVVYIAILGITLTNTLAIFPGVSAGIAILFYYTAKLFTHERVSIRLKLRIVAEVQIKNLKRRAAADDALATIKDGMQKTRLKMEETALTSLAQDSRIAAIQTRAMYTTLVKEIMDQYSIKPHSKLGKQLLGLVEEALHGASESPFDDAQFLDTVLSEKPEAQPATNGAGQGFLT